MKSLVQLRTNPKGFIRLYQRSLSSLSSHLIAPIQVQTSLTSSSSCYNSSSSFSSSFSFPSSSSSLSSFNSSKPSFGLISNHRRPFHHSVPLLEDISESVNNLSEIQDSKVIFDTVWNKITEKYQEINLRLPDEMIYLMGAPGSGKGTNTPFIRRARGITNPPIIMSSLLKMPALQSIIDSGGMISDAQVLEILIETLLSMKDGGVLIDGFPRTKVQVECCILLFDKMGELRRKYFDTPYRDAFRRPRFKIAVLYVDEAESVRRQLQRGLNAKKHNENVKRTGRGVLVEERATDFDDALIRKRYKIFKDHYDAMLRLKERFQFHLIDASGPVDKVRDIILKEFEYQSSHELDQGTYDTIQKIPLSLEVGRHARQELVRRLDGYMINHKDLFLEASKMVEEDFVPSINRHAMSGRVIIRSEKEMCQTPIFINMILDILSERGYHATFDIKSNIVAESVDPVTFKINSRRFYTYIFQVSFPKYYLRHEIEETIS